MPKATTSCSRVSPARLALRNTDHPHPRLQILGLIEARLIAADVDAARRARRNDLAAGRRPPTPSSTGPCARSSGLTPPERRIGQTAHDFTMAMGTGTVVLSRAGKRGGSPTVAVALPAAGWRRSAARRGSRCASGARGCSSSPAISTSRLTDPVPARRPMPEAAAGAAAEAALRDHDRDAAPRSLMPCTPSASSGCRQMPQVEDELGAGDYGSLMHAALHGFVSERKSRWMERRRPVVLSLERRLCATPSARRWPIPFFRTFRWPVMLKTIDLFLAFDAAQRDRGGTIDVETDGVIGLRSRRHQRVHPDGAGRPAGAARRRRRRH